MAICPLCCGDALGSYGKLMFGADYRHAKKGWEWNFSAGAELSLDGPGASLGVTGTLVNTFDDSRFVSVPIDFKESEDDR